MVTTQSKINTYKGMIATKTYKGKKFDGLKGTLDSTDGSAISCNSQWIAHTWKAAGGGAVAVYGSEAFGKFDANLPVIAGHKSAVMDLQFNPMHGN